MAVVRPPEQDRVTHGHVGRENLLEEGMAGAKALRHHFPSLELSTFGAGIILCCGPSCAL